MSRFTRVFSDPVVRFIVLGAAIFAVHRLLERGHDGDPIVVSSGFVEGLARDHAQRFGRPATPSEREALVSRFVREEALVREARRLGLDRTDPIVRRRLAQKMELVLRGSTSVERPTDEEIREYIEANPDLVATEPRYSFRQAFFSADLRGSEARTAAQSAAETLRGAANAAETIGTLGDAFVLGVSFEGLTASAVRERFGSAALSALESCSEAEVCGPIESRFGFHVLLPTEKAEAGTLDFRIARPLAERALLEARETRALEAAISALVAKQRIVEPRDEDEDR